MCKIGACLVGYLFAFLLCFFRFHHELPKVPKHRTLNELKAARRQARLPDASMAPCQMFCLLFVLPRMFDRSGSQGCRYRVTGSFWFCCFVRSCLPAILARLGSRCAGIRTLMVMALWAQPTTLWQRSSARSATYFLG